MCLKVVELVASSSQGADSDSLSGFDFGIDLVNVVVGWVVFNLL